MPWLCVLVAAALAAGGERPVLHFTPERNWINDPNGLIWADGEYHLFCQYNPEGDQWGHMSWGHAVSTNLFAWEHLPVAIPEAGSVMAFSGTAVLDRENTSGFGSREHPAMVAVFTGHDGQAKRQHQNLAYSIDRGRTWTRYERNPVVDLGVEEFRDPKVFWHGPTRRWVMVASLAPQRKALFFTSADLKTWTKVSEFGPHGAMNVPNWECPDLFELPLDDGTSRWVLVVSAGGNGPTGGPACEYFVGQFDGERFTNENPPERTLWLDWGKDFYAFQTFQDEPSGRRVGVAWMASPWYAGATPTSPWRGSMTVPREYSLTGTKDGVRLLQKPIAGVAEFLTGRGGVGAVIASQKITTKMTLPAIGRVGILEADFRVPSAGTFGVRVREGVNEFTAVGYDAGAQELYIDRTHSGEVDFHPQFKGRHGAALAVASGESLRLTIVVDVNSVEVFANGGRVAITSLVYPSAESRGVSLFAEGGAVTLERLSAVMLSRP